MIYKAIIAMAFMRGCIMMPNPQVIQDAEKLVEDVVDQEMGVEARNEVNAQGQEIQK